MTSAYHPQSNGQDERANQIIKDSLAKLCREQQNDWEAHLRSVFFSINTAQQVTLSYECTSMDLNKIIIGRQFKNVVNFRV